MSEFGGQQGVRSVDPLYWSRHEGARWEEIGQIPGIRSGSQGLFGIDQYNAGLYVISSAGDAQGVLTWLRYDLETQEWTTPQTVPGLVSRGRPSPAAYHGLLYLICQENVVLQARQLKWCTFDSETNTWSRVRTVPNAKAYNGPHTTALNKLLYVTFVDEDWNLSWLAYDSKTEKWTEPQAVPQVTSPSWWNVAAAGGKLFAVYAALEAPLRWVSYDPEAGEWSPPQEIAGTENAWTVALSPDKGLLRAVYQTAPFDGDWWWVSYDIENQKWGDADLIPDVKWSGRVAIAPFGGPLYAVYKKRD
ncbi:hypothetical protein [Marinactinospora rubrisoli]|uniref:Uncharacterized protein n=1 Tax=Marinactinospora rubrisoli TaxID=2715399 RepID=A0ABW2KFL5_9ACTN